MRYVVLVGSLLLWSVASEAQFRDAFPTVKEVDVAHPGLITGCGEFVDQVAHRLNRQDGAVRWGRKARQSDGGNPNCDALAYLNDVADRSRKTLVDIVIDSESPNAAPAWQVYPGDNLGNGYWTEPKTPDRDLAQPIPSPPLPIPPPVSTIQLDRIEQKIDTLIQQEAVNTASVRADIGAFRSAVGNAWKFVLKYAVPALAAFISGKAM